MSRYNSDNTLNFLKHFPVNCKIEFEALARNENIPDNHLLENDFTEIPSGRLVLNEDLLAKSLSRGGTTCSSMDFVFRTENDSTLLGDMKFNVDRCIKTQLVDVKKKLHGTYTRLHQYGAFHKNIYILMNNEKAEEGRNICSRLIEAEDDPLMLGERFVLRVNTLSEFCENHL